MTANPTVLSTPPAMTAITVSVPAETFDYLRRKAAALGLTVEEVARTILDRHVAQPSGPATAPVTPWDAWIASRAEHLPMLDDSRESIYE